MGEKKPRVSRIDGAAFVDLRVYALHKDTDLWALMAVVNVHDWKAEKGDLLFDFISQETGWGRGKVGVVVDRAEKAGLITTRDTGHGKIIEKAVAPMSWDEFHELRRKTSDIRNSNIRNSKTEQQESENRTPDARFSDGPNNSNAPERPSNAADAPAAPSPTPSENKNPGAGARTQEWRIHLETSTFGKAFSAAVRERLGSPYAFTGQDVMAWKAYREGGGRPDADLVACLPRFFDPKGYPSRIGAIHVAFFFRELPGYLAAGKAAGGGVDRSIQRKAAYYEPWDPRHPYHSKEDPKMLEKMRVAHEATYGPWTPKPDWSEAKP